MKYNKIPAVYSDTGLEYPEIRDFVKTFDNVVWLKPKMNFKQVIEKYGYPFISKVVSHCVKVAKNNPDGNVVKNLFNPNKRGQYGLYKWSFLIDAPFYIDSKCCDIMKKEPISTYSKKSNRVAMMGIMASESKLRQDKWLKYGCNAFDTKHPYSAPLSFWTEQDILGYIKKYNIKICSVYGDIIEENNKFKTTGCSRTGCMFCGYGCHLEKPGNGRFEMMKETHPQIYNYIMKPIEDGGLNYKNVIDWLNEHGNLNIKY